MLVKNVGIENFRFRIVPALRTIPFCLGLYFLLTNQRSVFMAMYFAGSRAVRGYASLPPALAGPRPLPSLPDCPFKPMRFRYSRQTKPHRFLPFSLVGVVTNKISCVYFVGQKTNDGENRIPDMALFCPFWPILGLQIRANALNPNLGGQG